MVSRELRRESKKFRDEGELSYIVCFSPFNPTSHCRSYGGEEEGEGFLPVQGMPEDEAFLWLFSD